eukprot:745893-Pyramimonas_sp.AAC.1
MGPTGPCGVVSTSGSDWPGRQRTSLDVRRWAARVGHGNGGSYRQLLPDVPAPGLGRSFARLLRQRHRM